MPSEDTGLGFFHRDPGLAQCIDGCVHFARLCTDQLDIAARNRRGACIASRFDPVAHHAVGRAMEAVFAVDDQVGRTDPLNFGAHGNQQIAQIDNFRLARSIVQNAGTLGEAGRHQGIFRGPHRDNREGVGPAGDAVGSHGLYITRRQFDFDAKGLKRLEMQVNRAVANGAATRQRNGSFPRARQHWAEHEDRGAHFADELIGRNIAGDARRLQRHDTAEIFGTRSRDAG